MSQTANRHPDQVPARWDGHVDGYQAVFEPLSDHFADHALGMMALAPGARLLDCAAGAGGGALLAARRGLAVMAIDASPAMVARVAERAGGHAVEAACMDAQALDLPDRRFDGALSVFGLILCPDPVAALRELARVTLPGGPVAVATWSEPERYELAARLARAAAEVRGAPAAPSPLPPQLRFRERDAFAGLFAEAGLAVARIDRVEARLLAPSADWLAGRLGFAPGLSDLLAGFGRDRDAVVARFAATLRADQGEGQVSLAAVGSIGLAYAPDSPG